MELKEQNNVLSLVLNTIEELKKKLHHLETKTVIESLDISKDLVPANSLDTPRRIKGKPIPESEIRDAQINSINVTECAKKLGVSYVSYRHWAKKYNIFKPNPWGVGHKKTKLEGGKYPLNEVLKGKFPNYPIYRLKYRVILNGIKSAQCENCGFNECRITDNKIPLLISFKDGNEKNHLLENIEILCYNCMFLIGRGYIRKGKVGFDLDKI